MDDCALCSRHVPARTDESGVVTDDNCTDHCRHREPATGSTACAHCILIVRDDIDSTTLAWLTLDADTTAASGQGGRGSERPIVGGLDRLNYICSARETLTSWCRAFGEDYSIRLPANDVAQVGAWLRQVWERRAHSHEAAGDFRDEMHDCAREGRRLTGLTEPGTVVPCQTADCGKALRVDMSWPDEPIVCRRCGFTWTGARLLSVAMDDADVWLDADAIAHIWRVPSRTLRSWAQTKRVRREHGRYLVADVRECLAGSQPRGGAGA